MSKTTFQVHILKTMMSGQKENGDIVFNPFYGRSEDEIINNLSYAKEVYINVFRRFICAWYHSRKTLIVPPEEWKELNV